MDDNPTSPGRPAPVDPTDADTALREGYPGLVRLAYPILSPKLDRHRRTLAAHGVVQQALPGPRALRRDLAGETDVPRYVRRRVVREAIRHAEPRRFSSLFPWIWGLQLSLRADAVDDQGLDELLANSTPEARAAWALVRTGGLSVDEAEEDLVAIGVTTSHEAIAEAAELDDHVAETVNRPLAAVVFDPSVVRLAPSDLSARPRRGRVIAAAVTAIAAVLALALIGPSIVSALWDGRQAGAETGGQGDAALTTRRLTADSLDRTSSTRWQDTGRIDFSAWPARGNRLADKALLNRALDSWSRGSGVTGVAGTPTAAPTQATRLLYAGEVDGRAVVLLHDGQRLARYTDGAGVVVSSTDDADVTTAGAVAISESAAGVRFLTAPWIASAERRDLVRPNTPAEDLARTNGITAVTPRPTCSAWPTLQLRSAPTVAEKHAFLVTYLGGLSPTHLTYMPPPSQGSARSPREATSTAALLSWAKTACGLKQLTDQGVRSAGNWVFAEQPLPGAGEGSWVCTRADSWRGDGWADASLLVPGAPAIAAGQAKNTAACSRFDQNVLAAAYWKAPNGTSYLLAAGSRHVQRMVLNGRAVNGNQAALPGNPAPRPRVTGRLKTGTPITALPR